MPIKISSIDPVLVREWLYEDAEHQLRWTKTQPRSGHPVADTLAGYIISAGYRNVKLMGRLYQAHRLLWVLRTGNDIPAGMEIDHVDGNRANNSPLNLRLATHSDNAKNRTRSRNNRSGHTGVSLSKVKQTSGNTCFYWRAVVGNPGWKSGYASKSFPNTDEGFKAACLWRQENELRLHGNFSTLASRR